MSEILKGNVVAAKIKEEISQKLNELKKIDKLPTLGIVRLGQNPSDISYEKSIIKNCDAIGIKSEVFEKGIALSTEELIDFIKELNSDDNISGILVFRPLPKHIDEDLIRSAVSPSKDVDCMHPLNLEKIFEGDMTGFLPATPRAAMEILLHNNVELQGKNVVVINRSMVVGKPLAMMLLEKNATVTICHSRTKNLEDITRNADIVITALGKPKFFDEKYFTDKSIVIDVGVSMTKDNKISGDVDYENVAKLVSKIAPVPGGVGSVTTTILLNQVVNACIKNN